MSRYLFPAASLILCVRGRVGTQMRIGKSRTTSSLLDHESVPGHLELFIKANGTVLSQLSD